MPRAYIFWPTAALNPRPSSSIDTNIRHHVLQKREYVCSSRVLNEADLKTEEVHDSDVPAYDSNYEDAPETVLCPAHTTERKLVTRIDLHVIPFLCVMYLLAFLDRVNIANANVFGLSKELKIVDGNKYNTALVIFFVPYILFEIPSNILLKKFKPRVWLAVCMFGFGLGT